MKIAHFVESFETYNIYFKNRCGGRSLGVLSLLKKIERYLSLMYE